MNVEEIKIENWTDLLQMSEDAFFSVYRGQSNANWDLETSLFRAVAQNHEGYNHNHTERLFAERMSLKTFKARAHFYLKNLPKNSDSVSWLSIMQHHGAPTRLLDFTHSLYVAIYFAIINATSDSCVWAIDDNWLRSKGSNLAEKYHFTKTNSLRFGELNSIYRFANHVINQNSFDGDEDEDFEDSGILMIELKRQIPRLAIQQGLFLMPTALSKSFSDNLSSYKNKSPNSKIQKILIPYELRYELLVQLKTMNITSESLFPGIDGFAKSLFHHEMI